MNATSDLKKLEQKIYLFYHQDGLLDLIIAGIILGLGFNEVIDSSIWNMIAILLVIAYMPLKKGITFPRLGYAKFNIKRGGVNLLVAGGAAVGLLLLLTVATLALLLSDRSSPPGLVQWIRENPLLLYGVLGLSGFALAGLAVGIKRLLVYALLCVVIMFGGHFLDLPISVPFLLVGGVILLIGTYLLISFLRKYPVSAEENHASQ